MKGLSLQELSEAVSEKDRLYAERTDLYESLRKEQLARTSASKEKQAQLRIVAVEVRLFSPSVMPVGPLCIGQLSIGLLTMFCR